MSEGYKSAISVLSFIVSMIDFDIEEGNLDANDDSRLLFYSTGGASGFLTLGMARDIVNEDPCQD